MNVSGPLIPSALLLGAIVAFASCSTPSAENVEAEWQILFDGSSIDGWDTYLGVPFDSTISREERQNLSPIGLNNDTVAVFTLVEVEGSPALRISGEYWGGISTKEEYANYHLQLTFKWGDLKWYPRHKDTDRRDSGLLYHGVGEHGVGDGFWLRSQELQIQEGDCGDYWGVAGAMFDINARLNADSVFQYDHEAATTTFGQESPNGRHCKKYPDAEKPSGEWNVIDLYCFEGQSVHVVNGVLTMALQNSRHPVDGHEMPLTRGKIQIQSEGAEVFYRDIKIRQIESIPEEFDRK